jgi:hypothetical protein
MTTGRNGPRRLQRDEADGSSGSFRNLFANIWSALGISEQQQQALAQKTTSTKPPPISPKASSTSSRQIVELRKSVIPPLETMDAGKKMFGLGFR